MPDLAEPSDTTALLRRWSQGDPVAFDQLATRLYRDIHAIAVRELRHERQLTIRPTALAHEAYLRLTPLRDLRWQDRAHFLSMAVRVMRQALGDEARRLRAQKRDGGTAVTLKDTHLGSSEAGFDALDVDAPLIELNANDAVAAEVASLCWRRRAVWKPCAARNSTGPRLPSRRCAICTCRGTGPPMRPCGRAS
jgi:RNA polymerase sigma-70 factor, ECF subfamily